MIPNATTLLTGIAALAAVLTLVVIAGRVARLGGWAPRTGAAGRRLRLEESLALDARRQIRLVSCDGRALLVLTGSGSDVVIGWVPDAPRVSGAENLA